MTDTKSLGVDRHRRQLLKSTVAVAASGLAGGAGATNAPTGTPISGGVPPTANVSAPNAHSLGARQYNILLVLVDQERYMGEGWPIPLPAHERLKRDGVMFHQHYIASAACSSSRSVIYTGQHMPITGIFDNAGMPYMPSLDPKKTPTIGHILRKLGYFTTYKGKFHLNNDMATANSPNHFTQLFEKMMDEYGFSDFDGMGDFIDGCRGGYEYDATVTAKSITWLRSSGHQLNRQGQPWFMAVNLVNPHDVFWFDTDEPGQQQQSKHAKMGIAPAPDHSLYKATWPDVPLPATLNESLTGPGRVSAHRYFQQANDVIVGRIPDQQARWRRYQDYYFNCIRQSDGEIASLLAELDALDLTRQTIVIFSSDHGELGGSHGGMTNKGDTAYEEQNTVPLIVMHPEGPKGQHCHALTSHLDMVPTIVGLTNRDTAPAKGLLDPLHGVDLSQWVLNPELASERPPRPQGALYCYNLLQLHDPAFTTELYNVLQNKQIASDDRFKTLEQFPVQWGLRIGIRSLKTDRYKLNRYFSFRQFNQPQSLEQLLALNDVELYDLQNDPLETRNLALDVKSNGALMMALNDQLNRLIQSEIGTDDGSFLHFSNWIDWSKPATMNS